MVEPASNRVRRAPADGDTLEVARSLTDVDFTPAQADAITKAVRRAAEHGDHVTSDQLAAALAEVRAEMQTGFAAVRTELAAVQGDLQAGIASLEARLVRWVVGTAVVLVGAVAALLRLWPSG